MRAHVDCFSGKVADLKSGHRMPDDILRSLSVHPRVSVWDIDTAWLRNGIAALETSGKVKSCASEQYPWIRYMLTDLGRDCVALAAVKE